VDRKALERIRLRAARGKQLTAMIDEGINEADAGLLISHKDVVAWVRSWGRPDELAMPEPANTD
jgi:predicted transcriptional regulator